MQYTLDHVLSNKDQNNFNLLRLFMAIAVLYNHSFVIYFSNGRQDITNYIFNFFDSGSMAVCVFFLISGMLLAQSYFTTSSKQKFILKRIFRLFPALLACLIFTIFVIGPFSTNLPIKEYFLSRGTYRYFYNIFLNNEVFMFSIPSCFTGNKVPDVINGSLWTLPFELVCYIFLFLGLSLVGYYISPRISRYNKLFITLLTIFFGIYLLNGRYIITRFKGLITGFNVDFATVNNPFKLFIFFFTGVCLYHFRRKIRLHIIYVLIPIFLLVISNISGVHIAQKFFEFAVIVTTALYFSGIRLFFKYNHKIDPSYGIYLYAWPVQQLLAFYFHLDAYASILVTLPIVSLLGILSYRYIERPALNYVNTVAGFIS